MGRGTAAGVGFALSLAADNPVTSVLTSNVGEDRVLVAHITTRSEQIFGSTCTLIADYAGEAWPTIPDERRRLMVDAVVRMAISHIVAPALPPERTARDIADIAVHVAASREGSNSLRSTASSVMSRTTTRPSSVHGTDRAPTGCPCRVRRARAACRVRRARAAPGRCQAESGSARPSRRCRAGTRRPWTKGQAGAVGPG
ncbi:hypothetical protein [Streptomyces sp. CB01635]|uniref:hypothetical protein n=1 Tax=Streptomyces sp. CB01635 TaxID=2020326 RepID=UPI003FA37027